MVTVGHVDRDRCAEGQAFVDAGDDLGCVAFFARCRDIALAGAAAIELELNIVFAQWEAWWATVDNDADASTMALAPCRNFKKCAKAITHNLCYAIRRSWRVNLTKVEGEGFSLTWDSLMQVIRYT